MTNSIQLQYLPRETMAEMLAEIAHVVGIPIPGHGDDEEYERKFFITQLPLIVKAHAKAAKHWEAACEVQRLMVYGR